MMGTTIISLCFAALLAVIGASFMWAGRKRHRSQRACPRCDHLLGHAEQCSECGETVATERDAHLRRRKSGHIVAGAACVATAACIASISTWGWKILPDAVLTRTAPTRQTRTGDSVSDSMAAELTRRLQAERSLTEPEIGRVLQRQLAEQLERGALVSVRPRWPRGLPLRLSVWGARPAFASPFLADGPLVIVVSSPNCGENARRTVFPFGTGVYKPTLLWADHWMEIPSHCVAADGLNLRLEVFRGSKRDPDQAGVKLAEAQVNMPVQLVETIAEAIQIDSSDSLTSTIRAAVSVSIQDAKAWLRVDHARLPADLSLGIVVETTSDGRVVGRGRLVCDDPRATPTRYGVELAAGDASETASDLPPSGRWIRLVGDPNLSLSLVDKSRCWSGELLVPWNQ
jgi:hypothetical protein